MTLRSQSEAFLAQLFSIQTCSCCKISFVFGLEKSPKFFVCILICFIFCGNIGLLVHFNFSLFKLFAAYLQQGSDPFKLSLCKILRGGMIHISEMLSLG